MADGVRFYFFPDFDPDFAADVPLDFFDDDESLSLFASESLLLLAVFFVAMCRCSFMPLGAVVGAGCARFPCHRSVRGQSPYTSIAAAVMQHGVEA